MYHRQGNTLSLAVSFWHSRKSLAAKAIPDSGSASAWHPNCIGFVFIHSIMKSKL
jgi:hypothetical protein